MRNGPVSEIYFGVIHGKLCVGRKDHLVVFIGMDAGVGEIQEGINQGRAIHQRRRDLDVRLVGVERDAHRPFHAMAEFHFSDPDRTAAVSILDQPVVHRKVAGSTVVVRDVPLDAAGDPGTDHADERRPDFCLPIDVVVAIGLVGGGENAPAQLRKHANLYVLVLQIVGLVSFVVLNIQKVLIEPIGIDRALRALIIAARIENRLKVGRPDFVSR